MILPEDTKPPIDSDDEEIYDDFEDSPTNVPQPFRDPSLRHYEYHDEVEDEDTTDSPYPLSPSSASQHPLLPYSQRSDPELGPAPPYTPREESSSSSSSSFWRGRDRASRKATFSFRVKRAKLRFAWAVALGLAVYLITFVGFWVIGPLGRGGPRHHGPYDGHGDDGHDGEGGKGDDGSPEQLLRDGSPLLCSNFTSDTLWSWIGEDEVKDQWNVREAGTNSTFLIPLDHRSEIFTHLYGPAAIGPIILGKYDADSKKGFHQDLDEEEERTEKAGFKGREVRMGEYVKVVVESLFDVLLPYQGDEQNGKGMTNEASPGWEMLRASKVCLMDRRVIPGDNRNGTSEQGDSLRRRNGNPKHESGKDGMGVGIYTCKPPNSVHPEQPSNPLRFRIHVLLPSYQSDLSAVEKDHPRDASNPLSLAQAIIDTLTSSSSGTPSKDNGHHGPPDEPPRNYVNSLELHGGVSDYHFGDLAGVQLGALQLESAVGKVEFGHGLNASLRAEKVKVKIVGGISGSVGVSESLEVETPVGQIDLNISLITPPEHVLWISPPPPGSSKNITNESEDVTPPPPPGPPERLDVCTLPPVAVTLRTASDHLTLRYGDWEIPCRGLRQEAASLVGDIEVHPHPLFQGPYNLATAVGEIQVDLTNADIPDPEDLGRRRDITIEKKDRAGAKQWSGTVTWEKDAEDETEEDGGMKLEKRTSSSPDRKKWRKNEKGLDIHSSAGSVLLIF